MKQEKIDNKDNYLSLLFIIVIIASVFFTYYRAVILRDYERIRSEEEEVSPEDTDLLFVDNGTVEL